MKDEYMDFEASLDKRHDNEKFLKEDIISLQEQVKGKDQAIEALSCSLMEKAKEHEQMSEMFSHFKSKLIQENCFHVTYGAKRHLAVSIGNKLRKKAQQYDEVTLAFMRDRTFEEEFFIVSIIPKTNREKRMETPVISLTGQRPIIILLQ